MEFLNICKFLLNLAILNDYLYVNYIEKINSIYLLLVELKNSSLSTLSQTSDNPSDPTKDSKKVNKYLKEFESIINMLMESNSIEHAIAHNFVACTSLQRLSYQIQSDASTYKNDTNLINLLSKVETQLMDYRHRNEILTNHFNRFLTVKKQIDAYYTKDHANTIESSLNLLDLKEEISRYNQIKSEIELLVVQLGSSCLKSREQQIIKSISLQHIHTIKLIIFDLKSRESNIDEIKNGIIKTFLPSHNTILTFMKRIFNRNSSSFFMNKNVFIDFFCNFMYDNFNQIKSYESYVWLIRILKSMDYLIDKTYYCGSNKKDYWFEQSNNFQTLETRFIYYSDQYRDYLRVNHVYFVPKQLVDHYHLYKRLKHNYKYSLFIQIFKSIDRTHLINTLPMNKQSNICLNRFNRKKFDSPIPDSTELSLNDQRSFIMVNTEFESILSEVSSHFVDDVNTDLSESISLTIGNFIGAMELFFDVQMTPTSLSTLNYHATHIELVEKLFNHTNAQLEAADLCKYKIDTSMYNDLKTFKFNNSKMTELITSFQFNMKILNDSIQSFQQDFSGSCHLFLKYELVISVDPNQSSSSTNSQTTPTINNQSNHVMVVDIKGHDVYLQLSKAFNHIHKIYNQLYDQLKLILKNQVALIDWKLLTIVFLIISKCFFKI